MPVIWCSIVLCRLDIFYNLKLCFQKKSCGDTCASLVITRHLKPYIALAGTSTPWSHPPPPLLDSMPTTLPFSPKSKSPTKNEYLSDLRIFKRMCHGLWRQLKKKNSGNVWGNSNINRSIKGLHLSRGHYFEERKIHLHCKSDFFFLIWQQPLESFLCWLLMLTNVESMPGTEKAQGVDVGPAL